MCVFSQTCHLLPQTGTQFDPVMKAPQAAALPQTWSAPCRHLLTYFCRLLTHHWRIRARVGAHGHEIKYLLRTPSISLCCQMQRVFFFSFIYLFFLHSSATASHSVCYIQNADATQRAGILNWGRLSTDCMSMCYQMHLQHSRRNSEKMHHLHSTDGNLLKLKNVLNCWKRCAVHRGCQARWHLLAACTHKKAGRRGNIIQNSFNRLTNCK